MLADASCNNVDEMKATFLLEDSFTDISSLALFFLTVERQKNALIYSKVKMLFSSLRHFFFNDIYEN